MLRKTICRISWMKKEMAQGLRLSDDPIAGQARGGGGDLLADLDHVVDVTLSVGASGDGQSDQLHRGGRFGPVRVAAEHHGADLTATHAAGDVERYRQ